MHAPRTQLIMSFCLLTIFNPAVQGITVFYFLGLDTWSLRACIFHCMLCSHFLLNFTTVVELAHALQVMRKTSSD